MVFCSVGAVEVQVATCVCTSRHCTALRLASHLWLSSSNSAVALALHAMVPVVSALVVGAAVPGHSAAALTLAQRLLTAAALGLSPAFLLVSLHAGCADRALLETR